MTLADALEKSRSYLSSPTALQSIERDPYWPKWDSPWWHMSLLHEMDLVKDIPEAAVSRMVTVLKSHYLPVFPINEDEVPQGTDPFRQIACLCSVGNMYQVLFACGVNVDRELPWMREWFLRYQLPDGGLNCDERAYAKPTPKSSIVTTVSCLEAVLFCRSRELTQEEVRFLDKGANYLLRQKLFRKASTGEVIDKKWLEIRFPRFYEYDFLRGFYFLAKWREQSGFTIPDELTDEVEELVSRQMTDKGIELKRYNLFDQRSYNPGTDGSWSWGQASEIDLMKAVSFDGSICQPLTKKWDEVKPKIATVIESVTKTNIGEVEAFLFRHEESSQFLINNLRDHGATLSEHHNSGNFKAIRIGGNVVSVFCLTRRGNLNIQSEVCDPKAILDSCLSEPIVLKGFIGDWNSVEPVYRLFRDCNPTYIPSYESKEILYLYSLTPNDPKTIHDKRVRLLRDTDYSQWLEFSDAYMSELSLPDELTADQKRRDFESQISKGIWWGLFDGPKLLSRVALNSKGEKIGQVGGVFTPKQCRQKGFAKAVMFHMLRDCRDLYGHTKNILFTGETDIPAQKLYESMGYTRIGSFALVLGQ